jgi:protein-tyrosine phosphatase
MTTRTPSVLFVCLGNICRSPLAEAALRHEAEKAGLEVIVDSAGTGDWHIGRAPDPRAQATAKRYGIDISGYKARQLSGDDFERFDMIFALDIDNLANIQRVAPSGHGASVSLLMDMIAGREGQPVADPYYGDDAGFEVTWADVKAAAEAVVQRLSR